MKRKIFSLFLTLALSASLFAGCSGGSGTDDTTAGATSEDTTAGATSDTTSENTEDTTGSDASGGSGDGVLNICVGPNPDTIDPALNSSVDGATMIIHAFEGLYRLDRDGVPEPGMAESVDISDDGLKYTFHLREGLKWSDGTPLTANDFVYSWLRAINPETAADYGYMFETIAGYEEAIGEEGAEFNPDALQISAPDDLTLEVTLISRTPYFLELTAFPTYMPVQEATVEANGDAWATSAATYVGNGPYKITEFVSSSHITMEKNEGYWELEKLGPEKIVFNLIEDSVAQFNAFQSGELSFVDDVPPDEIEALSSNPAFHMPAQMGTYYISFNNQMAPFDNPLVRKAFSLAIDRTHIASVLAKGYLPAGAWVPPGLSDADATKEFRDVGGDYIDPSESAYAANLEEAKAALAEAGYPEGEGLPTIEYIYNDSALHQAVAEALQDMWGQLGANVEIEVTEWATFLQLRKNGEYMTARDGWLNDYNDPIGVLDLFIIGGGNNNSQYKNAEYDALISQIKSSGDSEERMKLMHEAEDILMNDWVFAPVMYYADPYMLDPALDDSVWSSSLGYKYFMYADLK